uniref:Tripartite motif-containing protein 16-like n=1 Tax=Paramormyrops kingsleyae TaxID=1676925 RepID=A0A3B3RIS2_9TELE|nr:tripartite motif-containing protein 16-like [Paramormyrops kingsleyae]
MAESGFILSKTQFSCPICLDLLKDPVTINCGHSYCMSCIKVFWDYKDRTGVYSCPQCRKTFIPRPVLGRNIVLADMVEKLKKTGLQGSSPSQSYAGPGDVECDVCIGRKRKAVKSCLVCLFSYCRGHLQLHDELNPGKKHKLIDATGHLQDKVCPHHDKLLEVYCRSDQQCICVLCVMDKHRGHDTVSAAAGRTEKQTELQNKIQEKEKRIQTLRQVVDSLKRSAQAAVEDSDKTFATMMRFIKRKRSEVKELIQDQEKAAVSRAEGLLKQVEQEIVELKRRDAKLERFSHTEDHIHFLQSFQSLCESVAGESSPSLPVYPHCSFRDVRNAISDLKEQVTGLLKLKVTKISQTVRDVGIVHRKSEENFLQTKQEAVLHTPEPGTREEFLQYSCHLTLDPNTTHNHLRLLDGNRVVKWVGADQSYPECADRFDFYLQVLCREGLSGRCYWEAEWSGNWVIIAVSYKEISRRGEGNRACLGRNEKSWSLYCSPSKYFFRHNNEEIPVSGPPSPRIGVYLNHGAGTLSFYSISGTMTLLHRVQTTFTQCLHPAFFIYGGSKVHLC